MKQGKSPVSPQSLRSDAVIICEDITCGIVPIDPIDRRWRELTGRYLQKLAGTGAEVIRMVCGIPQVLINPVKRQQGLCKEILLLRHGMTEANEKHLYCGRLDWPLSPAGKEALSALQEKKHCGEKQRPQITYTGSGTPIIRVA